MARDDAPGSHAILGDAPQVGQSLASERDPRSGLFRSTLVITLFSVARIVLNFGLQTVLAAQFGAGREMDAYMAASTLPALVMTAFVTAVNVVLVPVLVEYRVQKSQTEGWKIVSNLVNLTTVLLTTIILLAVLGAPWIIAATVPGFEPGSEAFSLTQSLFQVLLPGLLFQCLAAILSSVYYTEKRFGPPSLAATLDSVVILGGALLLAGPLGIHGVAVATVLGAMLQFCCLLPIIIARGHYHFQFDYRHPGVIKVANLMLPLLFSTILVRASVVVDRFIASGLPEGSISYLGYAFKLAAVLSTLATQGITLSLLPLMSEFAAAQDLNGLRRTVSMGTRMATFIVTPLVVALFILRVPLIEVWLERGAFNHEATIATAQALAGYLGWMFVGGIGLAWVNAFYALQETQIVVKVGILGMAIEIPLAFVLSRTMGLIGLPLALTISAAIDAVLFALILRSRLDGLDGRRFWATQGKVLLASAAMAVVLLASFSLLQVIEGKVPGSLGELLQFTLAALAGGGVYLLVSQLLKCDETVFFSRWLQRKVQLWRGVS